MNAYTKAQQLIEQLTTEGVPPSFFARDSFELVLVQAIARAYKAAEQAQRDQQAAKALPQGWQAVAEAQGVCKSTVYKRAKRARSPRTPESA